jgi:hypothetical protein
MVFPKLSRRKWEKVRSQSPQPNRNGDAQIGLKRAQVAGSSDELELPTLST